MTATAPPPGQARGPRFLLLFALAYAGGVIGYVPLLTLLLPIKIEALGGQVDKVSQLGLATIVGAVVASVANILGGVLSDRWGRRPWLAGGLGLLLVSFAVIGLATSQGAVIAGVALFQFALNIMLAPIMAIAAEEVPDAQKGLLGGLFGAVYPLGAVAGIVVTHAHGDEAVRLALTGLMVAACALPFLLIERQPVIVAAADDARRAPPALSRRNLALVWLARLLVQMAGIILFAYFLFYFETVRGAHGLSPDAVAARISWLSGAVAIISAPLALIIGRLSDASGARKALLAVTVALMTVGLLVMALRPEWTAASIGYVLFSTGVGVFLALQATYAMHFLPDPRHRGRDLGVLNLTNTIPALIAPALAVVLVRLNDFRPLFVVLAVTTAAAGGLILLVRDGRSVERP